MDNVLKATDKLAAAGYRVITPTDKLPKIVIYDLPRAEPEQDSTLFRRIFDENIEGISTLTKAEHLTFMRRVSLFGSEDRPTMNMVARKALIDSGHVLLAWHSHSQGPHGCHEVSVSYCLWHNMEIWLQIVNTESSKVTS